MDELKDNTFAGLSGNFESIYNELMNNNDPDLVMADFRSYVDAWEKLTGSYGDQETWNRKALLNTASSGWFSSDRTIREYRDEICTRKGARAPFAARHYSTGVTERRARRKWV